MGREVTGIYRQEPFSLSPLFLSLSLFFLVQQVYEDWMSMHNNGCMDLFPKSYLFSLSAGSFSPYLAKSITCESYSINDCVRGWIKIPPPLPLFFFPGSLSIHAFMYAYG